MKAVLLERFSKEFKNMKVVISTATLANWVTESADRYFRPIYEKLHED